VELQVLPVHQVQVDQAVVQVLLVLTVLVELRVQAELQVQAVHLVLVELLGQAVLLVLVELLGQAVQAELLVRQEYLQVKYITLMKAIIVMYRDIKLYRLCRMELSKR
jgi:hypothetical protein